MSTYLRAFTICSVLLTAAGFQYSRARAQVAQSGALKKVRKAEHTSGLPTRPTILVIAGDHGEGTSVLSHALGAHPCFIDLAEPFDNEHRWYSLDGGEALFMEGMKPGLVNTLDKLQYHLDWTMTHKGYGAFNLSNNFQWEHPDLLDFFQTVQEEACGRASLPSVCQSRCILVHKMFPVFVSYQFSATEDYLKSEHTMVLRTVRDENETISSDRERFGDNEVRFQGLRDWNKFLNAKELEVSDKKTWLNISMEGQIWSSESNFLEVIRGLLPQFDTVSDDESLAPVLEAIRAHFYKYHKMVDRGYRTHEHVHEKNISDNATASESD